MPRLKERAKEKSKMWRDTKTTDMSIMVKVPTIRVFLVDDHPLFRQTMRSLLALYSNVELVGEASDVTKPWRV